MLDPFGLCASAATWFTVLSCSRCFVIIVLLLPRTKAAAASCPPERQLSSGHICHIQALVPGLLRRWASSAVPTGLVEDRWKSVDLVEPRSLRRSSYLNWPQVWTGAWTVVCSWRVTTWPGWNPSRPRGDWARLLPPVTPLKGETAEDGQLYLKRCI